MDSEMSYFSFYNDENKKRMSVLSWVQAEKKQILRKETKGYNEQICE
jgi:hypothetical protein